MYTYILPCACCVVNPLSAREKITPIDHHRPSLSPLKVARASLNERLDTLFNIFALHKRLQIRQKLLYGSLFTLGNGYTGRFERGTHTQRSLRCDDLRQFCCTSKLLSWFDHLLHQPDPQCLGCIELITGQ